jgi:DNA adenine methylase
MKTFIRWQGNKSKHINKFIKYIPEFTGTYIEPFLGSGALFLKLQPKKWIINDLNRDLINAWTSVRDNPKEIIRIFKAFEKEFKPLNVEDKKEYCQKITLNIESIEYNIKRAAIYMLMLYCSHMPNIIRNDNFYFPGLDMSIYIRNNYPFLKPTYYSNLVEVSTFINNSKGKIYNKSYEQVLDKAKKGDFVFLDPPYIEECEYQFNYNKDEVLDNTFLRTLYQQVKLLDKKGVKWLMTQADTKDIKRLFKEYTIKKMKVYRMGKKEYVNELIIMNY